RQLLRADDALLVDGELYAGDATVAGYDNPLNRRFAWAPLHSVGIGDADGALVFEARDDPRLPGLHLIAKHFSATRAVEARMGGGGQGVRIGRRERLQMNHSYKHRAHTPPPIPLGGRLALRWPAAGH